MTHTKEVRYPRSGEVDARLHMNTCAHIRHVNQFRWKGPDFLQEFALI